MIEIELKEDEEVFDILNEKSLTTEKSEKNRVKVYMYLEGGDIGLFIKKKK